MKKANLATIPEREIKSPQARYHLHRRNISEALGGKIDVGTWDGGHPFDVEWIRLPAGATNFPFHAHSAQWEMYVIIDGEGEMRGPDGWFAVGAGDSTIFPPHAPHQMKNTGTRDLTYYVIADHHPAEVTHYPDNGKWGIKPQRKYFEMTEVPYYEPGD